MVLKRAPASSEGKGRRERHKSGGWLCNCDSSSGGVDAHCPQAVGQGCLENLNAWLHIICTFFSISSHRLPVGIPLFCSWVCIFYIRFLASGGQEIISSTSLYVSKYFRYGFIGNIISFGLGIDIILNTN